jgi:hypothetical protein
LLSFSKEAEWCSLTNKQPGLRAQNTAFGKEKQILRPRKVIQAMEVEEKEKIRQIRSSFTV